MIFPKQYYGEDFKDVALEAQALEHINPKLLELESDLYQSKWFDYRHMNHVRATLIYMQFYKTVYQALYAIHFDHASAPYRKGIKVDDLFQMSKSERAGIWKGRQMADKHRLPYGFFIRHAMACGMTFERSQLPRPTQLYNEERVLYVLEKWRSFEAETVPMPCTISEWHQGGETDLDFRRWILQVLSRRPNPEFKLCDLILDGYLTMHDAVDYFGEEMESRINACKPIVESIKVSDD